jgi:glycosyltransferase involved in cell wall biosynthesis
MGRRDSFPPNVHFFGVMARAYLPEFLAGLDSFWMPFAVNELTQSMCPIKIFEVLSAGLPVVSSDLDECRAVAGELVLFARNIEDHLVQLKKAISLRSPEVAHRRVEAMRDYDWNNRYKEFLKLLQQ